MSAGQRIRQKREELGLTQDELAKKLGYKNRSSVNKIENSRDLSLKLVNQYAEALGCDPAYLLGWDVAENNPDARFLNTEMAIVDFNLNSKFAKLNDTDKTVVMNLIDSLLAHY